MTFYTIDLRTAEGRPSFEQARVALVLLMLNDREGSSLNYSRAELAVMADTQPEYVSRTLTRLIRAGILQRKGSVIYVLDREGLDAETRRTRSEVTG